MVAMERSKEVIGGVSIHVGSDDLGFKITV